MQAWQGLVRLAACGDWCRTCRCTALQRNMGLRKRGFAPGPVPIPQYTALELAGVRWRCGAGLRKLLRVSGAFSRPTLKA